MWSENVNGFLYKFVSLVLQASRAHNITIPGCPKYNVPSGKIAIGKAVATYYLSKKPYSEVAIATADDFNDDNVMIRESMNKSSAPRPKSQLARFQLFDGIHTLNLSDLGHHRSSHNGPQCSVRIGRDDELIVLTTGWVRFLVKNTY